MMNKHMIKLQPITQVYEDLHVLPILRHPSAVETPGGREGHRTPTPSPHSLLQLLTPGAEYSSCLHPVRLRLSGQAYMHSLSWFRCLMHRFAIFIPLYKCMKDCSSTLSSQTKPIHVSCALDKHVTLACQSCLDMKKVTCLLVTAAL